MLPPDFGVNFPKVAESPMVVGSFSAAATAACTVAFAPLWLAAEVLPELDGLLPPEHRTAGSQGNRKGDSQHRDYGPLSAEPGTRSSHPLPPH